MLRRALADGLEHGREDAVAVEERLDLVAFEELRAEQHAHRAAELRVVGAVAALDGVFELLLAAAQVGHDQRGGDAGHEGEEDDPVGGVGFHAGADCPGRAPSARAQSASCPSGRPAASPAASAGGARGRRRARAAGPSLRARRATGGAWPGGQAAGPTSCRSSMRRTSSITACWPSRQAIVSATASVACSASLLEGAPPRHRRK